MLRQWKVYYDKNLRKSRNEMLFCSSQRNEEQSFQVKILAKLRYRNFFYSILITVGAIDSLQRSSNNCKPMTLLMIPDNKGTVLPGPLPGGSSPPEKCVGHSLNRLKNLSHSQKTLPDVLSWLRACVGYYICWHIIQMSWLVCIQWIYLTWVCSQ